MHIPAVVIFLLCGFAIATVFALYPVLLAVLRKLRTAAPNPIWDESRADEDWPSVSCIVATRNAEAFIEDKIRNCLALDYPPDRLQFFFYTDGSTDGTADILRKYADEPRFVLHECPEHLGKIAGLNTAVPLCDGDLLFFSDTDAQLEPEALKAMVRHFANPEIGGVCGRREIAEDGAHIGAAQHKHVGFSTRMQTLETEIGSSVTSSEGKIYVMRRALYRPIIDSVTDDLYTCLTVIRQHKRFIYEPDAIAAIHLPSRSLPHEYVRRRRIVSTSLRGIWNCRELLNPFRFGVLSVGLWVNKIMRRLLTLFLLGFFVSNLFLLNHPLFWLPMAAQVGAYGLAFLHLPLSVLKLRLPIVSKLASTGAYFVVGNLGSFVGVLEFLTGKRVNRWEPVKKSP